MKFKKTAKIYLSTCFIFLTCFFALQYKQQFIQPDLTVVGYISEKDGLGRQTAELIDTFRSEFRINFVATRKEKGDRIPKRFQKLLKKNRKWGKVIIFEDMLWRPGKKYYSKILSSDRDKSIRIAYSLWESTQIPDEWVHILNSHFDAVVVPSPFLVKVYTDSGVKIPIFELPLGLNLDKFLEQPLKKTPGKPFVFGNLSACSERKNQLLLIRAFAKVFGNDPEVHLRINSRYGEKEIKDAIIQEINNLKLNNVTFTQFAYSTQEYLELFKKIDCYVSPSKGEGFSIQPREAMALGIPVIATDNTGQSVICDTGLIKKVAAFIEEPAIFPWGDRHGNYFNCTEEELANAMYEIRMNYSDYIVECYKSRECVKQYQFKNLKSLYRSLIYPEQIKLEGKNEFILNGLITNSNELYDKYQKI